MQDEREREGSVQTLPEKLDNAFKVLDPQERGFIEEKELKHLLMTLGDKLSEEDVADMLKDAERTEDNHVRTSERTGGKKNKDALFSSYSRPL